ncbi:MAG TPA: hypothetical protein DE036_08260 [Actinobacteria bacterium]|nr:hypothetical protein [Actinomycetota bacterium]
MMEKKSTSSWLEKTALGVVILVVLAVVGVTLFPRDDSEDGVLLATIDVKQVKEYLLDDTELEITDVEKDPVKNLITVSYFNDEVKDDDEVLFDLANDSTKIMPLLFEMTSVERVKIVQLGTFMNQAGDSSVEISAAITLTREKVKEIDWKTVNSTNRAGLIAEAAEVYIDPEVRAQLDNTELLNSIITQLSTN